MVESTFFHVCPFDRGVGGLKLFGQCHLEPIHFKKGHPLGKGKRSLILTCSPAACFVSTFELETTIFFGPASVCHSDSFTWLQ